MLRKKVQGITLVELIVVISILMTLAALAYPVFTKVIRRNYQIICASQLRQVYLAMQMYVNDKGDYPHGELGYLTPYLKTREILVCPWLQRAAFVAIQERQKQWQKAWQVPWSSYRCFICHREALDSTARREDSLSYSYVLSMRGEMTPAVVCYEHREPSLYSGIAPLCAWFFPEEPHVILRLNGQVSFTLKGGAWCNFTVYPDGMMDAWEF